MFHKSLKLTLKNDVIMKNNVKKKVLKTLKFKKCCMDI